MPWARKKPKRTINKGKKCKYPGCKSNAYVRGYCSQHCKMLYNKKKKVKKNVSKSR